MRLELIFPLQRGAALPIELCSLAHFINILLERVDSNHRSRKTADLQSAAFDRSATLQFNYFFWFVARVGVEPTRPFRNKGF